MKSCTDIIAAALDVALSPRPLTYTTGGLAAAVVDALQAEGYSILPPVTAASIMLPVEGLEPGYVTLPIDGWVDLEPEQKP